MTAHTHSAPLPAHQYVWIESGAIGEHDWVRAIWFGMTSYPGRAFGCHVMLECGAVYRGVPLHQIASRPDAEPEWSAAQAQTWDAYGYDFSLLSYTYLAGMGVRTRLQDGSERDGIYLYTLVPLHDGFSAEPEQAKEFYFVELKNGRYTAQPTNHVLIDDRSFVTEMAWPKHLRRQNSWHSAEE